MLNDIMMKNKHQICLVVALTACFLLAGCGKAARGTGGSGFSSPEVQALWDKTVAADKTNDYVLACQGYNELLHQKDRLSESQVQLVVEGYGQLFHRAEEAARAGDAGARQALAKMRQMELPRGGNQ